MGSRSRLEPPQGAAAPPQQPPMSVPQGNQPTMPPSGIGGAFNEISQNFGLGGPPVQSTPTPGVQAPNPGFENFNSGSGGQTPMATLFPPMSTPSSNPKWESYNQPNFNSGSGGMGSGGMGSGGQTPMATLFPPGNTPSMSTPAPGVQTQPPMSSPAVQTAPTGQSGGWRPRGSAAPAQPAQPSSLPVGFNPAFAPQPMNANMQAPGASQVMPQPSFQPQQLPTNGGGGFFADALSGGGGFSPASMPQPDPAATRPAGGKGPNRNAGGNRPNRSARGMRRAW